MSASKANVTELFQLLAFVAQARKAGLPVPDENFIPPNLSDPNYVMVDLGPMLIAVATTLIVLASISVALRLYTRYQVRNSFALDDWLIVPAFVFALGVTVVQYIAVHYSHLGRHIWDASVSAVSFGFPMIVIHAMLHATTLFFVKMSILVFLYSLAGPSSRGFRIVIIAYGVFHLCFWFISINMFTFQCHPVAAAFKLSARLAISKDRCLSNVLLYRYLTIFHVISDFAILILPAAMVWNLQLATKKKLGVICLFAFGSLTCVSSLMRIFYINAMTLSYDMTWVNALPAMWGQVEACLAIICACAPAIKALVVKGTQAVASKITANKSKVSISGANNSKDLLSTVRSAGGHSRRAFVPISHKGNADDDGRNWTQVDDRYFDLKNPNLDASQSKKGRVTVREMLSPDSRRGSGTSDEDGEELAIWNVEAGSAYGTKSLDAK